MIRVVLLTAVYARHAITRVFWAGVDRLRSAWVDEGVAVLPLVVGSSDGTHERLAEGAGAVYLEHWPNQPIGAKWNAGLEAAKRFAPDYVLCVGSDDLLGASCTAPYVNAMRAGKRYVGLRGFYQYNAETGDALRWDGYTNGRDEPIGPGRLLAHDVLEAAGWQLWDPRLQRNLDGSMTDTLRALGIEAEYLPHPLPLIDIKSDVSLSPYELLEGERIDPAIWRDELSPSEWHSLTQLPEVLA